jgi:C-terminal processing protease CtpA/Prc
MTAAQAGVEIGDEIVLIDGRDVRSMSPEAIHLALEGDERTAVSLTILRRGKILRISVKRGPLQPKR